MKKLISDMGYNRVCGRAVKVVDVLTGTSVATELIESTNIGYYFPPSSTTVHNNNNNNDTTDDDDDLYFQCQFPDGVYMRIPKQLSPDMETIGLELGCFILNGAGKNEEKEVENTRDDFHRLVVIGDRTQGRMHTTVYERYSHGKKRRIKQFEVE